MRFHAEEEKELFTGFKNRLVSDCGRVEIGLYQVFYGWRVRAGYVGEPTVALDWCAGDDMVIVSYLFNAAVLILSQRDGGDGCFNGIPGSSAIKPFYKDADFMRSLMDLIPKADGVETKNPVNPA